MEGKAIIFSAPSGSGKTTIVQGLLEKIPSLKFSISATTRKKREKETDGNDYYFLSKEDFKDKIDHNELIEWEEVYADNFYGTLKSEVYRIWEEGNHVVFDVDVQGGMKLKESFGDRALAVFVKVPSLEILTKRLRSRNTEDEQTLKMRVDKATLEMKEAKNFDQVVINENLEEAVANAEELVNNFISS